MTKEFTYRLDFYWKAIAFYAVALIGYALVRGLKESMTDGRIELVLDDPLLILLFAFVVGSALTLLITWFMRRRLVVDEQFIIFRNRLRERKIMLADITRISIGREKMIKVRGAFKVVKIRLATRRRLLRIRTSSFYNEHELVDALHRLKSRIGN